MKTVLITGASRGLGKALAEVFAKNNFHLILHCKSSEMPIIPDTMPDIIRDDITKNSTIRSLIDAAEKKNIYVLINNAGVYVNQEILHMKVKDIENVIKVNLLAPMLLIKGIWPIFQRNKKGTIININSMAGKHGGKFESVYSASKFGLGGFSQALKYEVNNVGIRIIDVFIGAMKTDMTKHREDWDRLIDPLHVAKTIFSLCNDYSSMNVSEIKINRRKY